MADYTGFFVEPDLGAMLRRGIFPGGGSGRLKVISATRMVTTRAHGGSYSLELDAGRRKPVWAGCNAGTAIGSVWCWSTEVGTAALVLIDGETGETLDGAANTTTDAWEKLEVTAIVNKAVHVLVMENRSTISATKSGRVWFDDLLVE